MVIQNIIEIRVIINVIFITLNHLAENGHTSKISDDDYKLLIIFRLSLYLVMEICIRNVIGIFILQK